MIRRRSGSPGTGVQPDVNFKSDMHLHGFDEEIKQFKGFKEVLRTRSQDKGSPLSRDNVRQVVLNEGEEGGTTLELSTIYKDDKLQK